MNTSDQIIANLTEKIGSLHSAPADSATATSDEIIALKSNLESMTTNYEYTASKVRELAQRIVNVKGHIFDMYSMNGEVDDDIKEIARLLDITLMKEIAGTATFEISWTAQVPLDFDADDFEITFDVNCETYEAEEFDWNEDSCDVSGEDV